MREQTYRLDATREHINYSKLKLNPLLEQKKDLHIASDQMIEDFSNGNRIVKVYRQVKMYIDNPLNPVLYNTK